MLPNATIVFPTGLRPRLDFAFIALLISAGVLIALEILFGPQRWPSADNAWHFRWASDIIRGQPIYWSGVDGNRTFPDLIFSLLAVCLPGGKRYDRWLDYYYAVLAIAVWASLLTLSTVLYSERVRRCAFVCLASASLVGVSILLPYWDGWIMTPGDNGGSIPVVLIAVSILLVDRRQTQCGWLLVAVYIVLCAGLVMANRYLALIVMFPLFPCAFIARRTVSEKLLVSTGSLLATCIGFLAWQELNTSPFFRLVAPGHHPSIEDAASLAWWLGRFSKELNQMASASNRLEVLCGLFIIVLAIAYGMVSLFKSELRKAKKATVLSIFVSLSGLISLTFIFVMVDDVGDWRYRYLTVPLVLSIFGLIGMTVETWPRSSKLSLLAPISITAPALIIFISASSNVSLAVDYEASFRHDIGRLSTILREHDHEAFHVGLANYWLANEVTARDPNIQLLSVGDNLTYRAYNNNAEELCRGHVSFVLVYADKIFPDRPRVDLSTFPPTASINLRLGRFGIVKLLLYEGDLLNDKVLVPARAAAKREFPSFSCKQR